MMHGVVHMAAMGMVTSVLTPTLVLATRRRTSWRLLSLPPAVALIGFVLIHAAVVLSDRDGLDLPSLALHGVLLTGAIAFWLPVLAGPRRLDAGLRGWYLLLAAPSLDLPAVVTVARGDSAGGLAMIVAMMPIGVAGVALVWQWLRAEERAATASDAELSDFIPAVRELPAPHRP